MSYLDDYLKSVSGGFPMGDLSRINNSLSIPVEKWAGVSLPTGYTPTDPVKLPPKPLGTFSSGGPDPLPMNPLPMQTAGPYPMPSGMGYNGAVSQFGTPAAVQPTPLPNPVGPMTSPQVAAQSGIGTTPNPVTGPGSPYDNWRLQFAPTTSPVQNTATRHTTGSPDTTSNAGGFYGSKGYFDFRGEPQRYTGG